MALTLECSCSANVSLCNLTRLVWRVDVIINQQGSVTAIGSITLTSGDGHSTSVPAVGGHYEVELLPISSWAGDTEGHFSIDASTFQTGPGQHYSIGASDHIDQYYQCINIVTGHSAVTIIPSSSQQDDGVHSCDTGKDDQRSTCQGLNGSLFKSTPLGACNGCSSNVFNYYPTPILEPSIQVDNSGTVCLCATGGTGDYSFSIVAGSLPCGMTLNPATGCITGTADGTCDGTSSITYRVQDSGGADTGNSTGGLTVGGTANVFGGGATRLSGGQWTSDMVGRPITFGSTSYTVSTVTDGDHLTFTPTNGIVANEAWSYTSPVIPPPTPGPPEFAEVTCGYVGGCPTGDSGLGGNQAF